MIVVPSWAEEEGNAIPQNIGKYSPNDMVSHPRKHESSAYEQTHPSHFFEFCKHNNNSWVVFPQHSPKVFSGVEKWALRCDVSSPVTITIYETGIYVIRAFYGTYRCQTHPCWFKWQDMHQSVLMLVAGQVCADEASRVSLNIRQFL